MFESSTGAVVYPEGFEMAHARGRLTVAGRPCYVGDWAGVWDAVWMGQEPAESLPSAVRAALFRTMLADGRTVEEVAAWTRTTEYTVRRMLRT